MTGQAADPGPPATNAGDRDTTVRTDDRRLLVLSQTEIAFIKDALWFACLAEQLATSEDPVWERAFLEDLRAITRSRREQHQAGFQDVFLELAGTPLADLPPAFRQYLGGEGLGFPTEEHLNRLIDALRDEIGRLSLELAAAHRALAASQPRRGWPWWPFRRRARS